VRRSTKLTAFAAVLIAVITVFALVWHYYLRPLSFDEVVERKWKVGDIWDVEGRVVNVKEVNTSYGPITVVGFESSQPEGLCDRRLGANGTMHLIAPLGSSPQVGERFRTTLRFVPFSLNGVPAVWSPSLLCPFPSMWDSMGSLNDAIAFHAGILLRFNGTNPEGWTTYSIVTENGDRYLPERIPVSLRAGRSFLTEDINSSVAARGWSAAMWIILATVTYVEFMGEFDNSPELDRMTSLADENSTNGRLHFIDRDADGWVGNGDEMRVHIPGTNHEGVYETYFLSLGGIMNSTAYAGGGKLLLNGPKGPYEVFLPQPEWVQLFHAGDVVNGTVSSTLEVSSVEFGPPRPYSDYGINLCRHWEDCLVKDLRLSNGTARLPGGAFFEFFDHNADGLLDGGDRFVASGLKNRTRLNLIIVGPGAWGVGEHGELEWITGYGHVVGTFRSFQSSVSPGPPYTLNVDGGWWHPALDLDGPITVSLWQNSSLVLENATIPNGTQLIFPNGTLSYMDNDADGMFGSEDHFLLQGEVGRKYRLEVQVLWSNSIYGAEVG